MKQKIATAWVKALRSGEYEFDHGILVMRQTIGEQDFYDPLGVLCDLAVNAKKASWKRLCPSMIGTWWCDDNTFWLPDSVITWAGICDMDYVEDTILDAFDRGTSVKTIATFIEDNYRML